MVVGTIPGAILGKLFDKQIEEHLRTPVIIGISLILVALIMWWADSRATLARKLEQSNLGDRHRNRYGSGRRSLARRFAFRHHHHPLDSSAISPAKRPPVFHSCSPLPLSPAR